MWKTQQDGSFRQDEDDELRSVFMGNSLNHSHLASNSSISNDPDRS